MACGVENLEYDSGLLEDLNSIIPSPCRLVRRLQKPPDRLYIRVNTLKTGVQEYIDAARDRGYRLHRDDVIPEAVWAPVHGPYHIDDRYRKVVADKRAAEAVMMGSNLYAPGILYADNVSKGDRVTIVDPNGTPVAEGIALMSWEEVKLKGRGKAVEVTKSIYKSIRVSELPGYEDGLIYGQSWPSMHVARILDPGPRELIVDMNAAPGGKVSHIAQLAPGSRIIAVDRESKVGRLRATLNRLGIRNVEVVPGDSRSLTRIMPGLEGRVDAVIIDPPCTNLGVIPKIRDRKTLKDALTLSRYQRGFIREAYRLLRRGGRLVYSTCTLTTVENELNVKYALDLGFELIQPPSWVSSEVKSGYGLRFYPHVHGVPGFFISILMKT